MQVNTFLTQLAAQRRHEQALARSAITLPDGFRLDADLELAVRYRWLVSPVFAQTIFPPRAACAGVPDNNPEQISSWAANYGDTCNWAFFPSPECPVLEISLPLARYSLEWLLDRDNWDWRRTLRFRAGNLWFAMLSGPASATCLRTTQLPGLRLLYNGNSGLLIPPSRICDANPLEYADPRLEPTPVPASIFDPVPGVEFAPEMILAP